MSDGTIHPLREATLEHVLPASAASFTFHADNWISWGSVVNAVPGPVAQDRLYVTGDAQPRVIVNGGTRNLALPAPAAAPTVAAIGDTDPEIEQTVLFTFTYVTDQDEESPPAPPSAPIMWNPPLGVTITDFAPPPPGRGVSRRRIYRSETSAFGVTDFYFVAEQPIAQSSFTYEQSSHPLQEVIQTNDYDTPPTDMQGIISMPNGMMAAFSGKEILFSEPFVPHAWPIKYRLTVETPVVGLAAFGSTLAILTTGQPYLAQGTAPENMVMERIEVNYPCASSRGIVDLGYAAVYPSPEGLVMIMQGRADVISRKLWTREQWEALNPSTWVASQYDGAYVVSYETAPNERAVLVVDLTGEQPFITNADIQAAAMHYDIKTGSLFFLEGISSGTNIKKWDAGDPMVFHWRSGLLHSSGAIGFGAGLTQTNDDEGQAITTRVIASGVVIRETADADTAFRIPDGLHNRWQFEFEGSATVTGYLMAGDISEMAGG
ncbi:hypothetical protein ACTZWY_12060 [Roseinatronobacter sp. NSM]